MTIHVYYDKKGYIVLSINGQKIYARDLVLTKNKKKKGKK